MAYLLTLGTSQKRTCQQPALQTTQSLPQQFFDILVIRKIKHLKKITAFYCNSMMVLLGRETPRNFARRCAAQGLKFNSYSWSKYFNFSTLFQTLPLKKFRKICKIQVGPEKETYFRKKCKRKLLKATPVQHITRHSCPSFVVQTGSVRKCSFDATLEQLGRFESHTLSYLAK